MQRLQPSTRGEMKARAGHVRAHGAGRSAGQAAPKVAQSCPTLQPHGLQPARLLWPWDSQARILEWGAMPSSRGSSQRLNPCFLWPASSLPLPHHLEDFQYFSLCHVTAFSVLLFKALQNKGHFPPGLPPGRYVKLHHFRARKALTTLPSSGFVTSDALLWNQPSVSHDRERTEQQKRHGLWNQPEGGTNSGLTKG